MTKLRHAAEVIHVYRNWWLRFADYAGLLQRGKRYPAVLRNGLVVELRAGTSDWQIADEIFIHRIYDRGLHQVRKGSIVIDIGAQCGMFTLAAASRGARVFAYEPLPENYDLLLANVRRSGFADAVSARNVAVAGQTGHTDLYVAAGDTGGATVRPECHGWSPDRPGLERRSVPCLSLHDIFQQSDIPHCDLLKMDCEGSEYDILAASQMEDLAKIGAIILEYHRNVPVEELTSLLREASFQVELVRQYNILFASRDSHL